MSQKFNTGQQWQFVLRKGSRGPLDRALDFHESRGFILAHNRSSKPSARLRHSLTVLSGLCDGPEKGITWLPWRRFDL